MQLYYSEVLKTEMSYYAHTHKVNKISYKDQYRMNNISYNEMLENLTILLDDEKQKSTAIANLTTNNDALKLLTHTVLVPTILISCEPVIDRANTKCCYLE